MGSFIRLMVQKSRIEPYKTYREWAEEKGIKLKY